MAGVDGLRPGIQYTYELRTDGRVIDADVSNPGVVRTLAPPAGPPLFTLAVVNDIHVGEGCSGTIAGDFPPCFRAPDYAITMTSPPSTSSAASSVPQPEPSLPGSLSLKTFAGS